MNAKKRIILAVVTVFFALLMYGDAFAAGEVFVPTPLYFDDGNTSYQFVDWQQVSGEFCSAGISELRTGFTATGNTVSDLGDVIDSGVQGATYTFAQIFANHGSNDYLYTSYNSTDCGNAPNQSTSWMIFNIDASGEVTIYLTPNVTSQQIDTFILQPSPYGTTTASTTVSLSVNFSVQSGFDFQEVPPVFVGFRLYNAVTNEIELEWSTDFEANTAFNYTYSTTTTLSEGSKTLVSFIERQDNGQDVTPEDSIFFNVISNTYLLATGIESPRANPSELTQIDCDTFDIGCQFQKALTFLFVPSQDVLDRFSSLWQRVRYKVPFGYVSVVIDQLGGLDDTATAVFDLGDLPFMNTIFTPFRDLLGVLLWGIFAVYFYQHRLTKLDI